jgi:Cupin
MSLRGVLPAVHARDDGILVKLSMPTSRVKLLTNFRDGDLVTEILRSVTLKTVVFGRAELRSPWGLEVDLPGRAVFHIVLRGECFFRAANDNFLRLSRGDTILFPQADVHHLTDHSSTPARPCRN